MNEKKSFKEWVKYKLKVIMVSDRRFFMCIWITAITISLVTVIISASVIASAEKKEKQRVEQEEQQKKQAEQEAIVASITDARAEKASITDAENAWMLVLVNMNHPAEESLEDDIEFTELVNGHKVDKRMYPDLQLMFDNARSEGLSPTISASYIAPEDVSSGGSACELDHTTGLAIDLTSSEGGDSEEALLKWLHENAAEYGFIFRYPEDKYSVTGVRGAENHLRYVGTEAAQAMVKSGECLEEFLGSY